MYAVEEQPMSPSPMSPHSPYLAYEAYQSSPHYVHDLQQVLQNEAENELDATLSCRAASERRRMARQPPVHPVSPPAYPCAPAAPSTSAEEDSYQDCDYEDLKHPDKPFPRPGQTTDIPLDELVDRVKRGQRASAEWKARWWAWCDVNGGTRDPAKLPFRDLCMAVAQCGEPPLGPLMPATAAASPTAPSVSASPRAARSVPRGAFPPAPVVVDSPYHAELVHKIKIGQKVSESWKAKWWQYCATHLTSTYDPTRHPLSRLLEALKEVGFPPDVPDADTTFEHEELVEKVKALQRNDLAFKAAWGDYCEEHGKGRRDPAKHSASFIVRALEALGQTKLLR